MNAFARNVANGRWSSARRFLQLLHVLTIVSALAALWIVRATSVADFGVRVFVSYVLAACFFASLGDIPFGLWTIRFVALTASMCLVVGVFELAVIARVVDFRQLFRVTVDEPWRQPINRLDSELLHLRKPNLHLVGEAPGDIAFYHRIPDAKTYHFDVQYDGNGFRNRMMPAKVDVAVIGDSFIEAFAVGDEELATSQLAGRLGVDVANFGQIWYGPQQHLIVLNRFVVPLRPKYCVWCIFEGNDLSDIARYDAIMADWPRQMQRLNSPLERSFVRNALLAGFERFGAPPVRPDGENIVGTRLAEDGVLTRLYFYYPGRKLDELDEPLFARLRQLLHAGAESCRVNGIQLLVAVVPTKFRVHGDRFQFRPRSPCRLWESTDFPMRLQAAVKKMGAGTDFVDLGVAFKAEAAKGKVLYLVDDTHWSVAGHRVAAQALAEAIRKMAKP